MHNNAKGLGFGIFLLTAGIIWMLAIAKIVTISTFYSLFILWPLILITLGIGIIFRRNVIIRLLTWIVLVAVIVAYGYFIKPDAPAILNRVDIWTLHNHYEIGGSSSDSSDDGKKAEEDANNVSYEMNPNIEESDLKLDMGATKLTIDSQTDNLFDASFGSLVKCTKSERSNGKNTTIKVKSGSMTFKDLDELEDHAEAESRLHLNKGVLWNIDLDTGIMSSDLDLSDIKVQKLKVETGLSKVKIYLGSYDTKIDMEADLSKVDLVLPEDTGIKIKFDGTMSNTNINGSGWTEDEDWHYSPDYDSKKYKIEAEIEINMGKLNVSD
jgi:hypothetical protein